MDKSKGINVKNIYSVILLFFVSVNSLYSFQLFSFTPQNFDFRGASYGATEFGDYDADGDLDLLVIGEEDIGVRVGVIYINVGDTFDPDSNIVLPYEFVTGDAKWGDFDNDGDLDVLLSGQSGNGRLTTVLRNDNGTFNEVDFGLINLQDSAVDWGDIDNDGDIDAVVTGFDFNFDQRLLVYKNSGDGFDLDADIAGVRVGDLELVDFDLDGDLDVFITGSGEDGRLSIIYENTPDGFVDSGISFAPLLNAASDWGDYDQDGDLDLILCGNNGSRFTAIYRNDITSFNETSIAVLGIEQGDVKWADFDNDGDLDFIINGVSTSSDTTLIYQNNGSSFTTEDLFLPYGNNSAISVGDYDNDGDMDFAISARYTSRYTTIFKNNSTSQNTPPGEPVNLTHTFDNGVVVLNWDRGTDAQSAKAALSYNLKVGTIPGASDIMTAHVTPDNSFMLSRRGNVEQNLSWPLKDLPLGTYFWTVQSVDNNYVVSEFVPEQSFTVTISPLFTERDIGMPDFHNGDLAWGDYDSDGDLDIAATGFDNTNSTTKSVIFTNGGSGSFADLNASLQNASDGNIEWGDYDRDRDLDLLLSGNFTNTIIYRNDNNTFVNIAAGLPGFNNGDAFWVDYDNDGDLDVHLVPLGELYQNNNNLFSLDATASANLLSVTDADAAWGDYDNDGDKDLIVVGTNGQFYGYLYRNDGGTFTDWEFDFDATDDGQGFGYPNNGYAIADVDWGDYDFDGDLDFIISGEGRSNTADIIRLTVMYENRGRDLINPGKWLFVQTEDTRFENQRRYEGVGRGTINWGDFGNDGLLDFLVTGSQGTSINQSDYISLIYSNAGTDTFELDVSASGTLRGMGNSAAAVGDYDNDGDLDIIQFGYSGTSGGLGYATRLFINDINEKVVNNRPSFPTNLRHVVVQDTVFLFWDPAEDDRTPQAGLTYNVRIGNGPGAQNVVSAHAFSDGKLKITTKGNAESALIYKIVGLPKDQEYYWSVQAIDAGFSSSTFAQESVFNTFNPSVNILSPNGGEVFIGGEPDTIFWESNNVEMIRLEYSPDLGSNWFQIVNNFPAIQGKFIWNVPEIESSQALIRISDANDSGIFDNSNAAFEIIKRFIRVDFPNGGQFLVSDSTYFIDFFTPYESDFRLEYSVNAGAAWTEIEVINDTFGPSSVLWLVPNVTSLQCLVRVSDLRNTNVRDTSDAFFAIGPASDIQVTSPNGGETWNVGQTRSITWTSNTTVITVKIEYSTNNGSSWNQIVAAVAATTGSYSWTVPDAPSTNCLVRISDVLNATVNDVSDGVFTIASGSGTFLSLNAPNGPESWEVGLEQLITWNSSGVNKIKILFSPAPSSGYTEVTTNINAADGSFSWIVPNAVSIACRVKIISEEDAQIADSSDSFFKIVDTTPPQFSNFDFSEDEMLNTESPVSVDVIDNTEVLEVKLFYRRGGDAAFQFMEMGNIAGNRYSAPIPSFALTTAGVEFYVFAKDLFDNESRSQSENIEVMHQGIGKPNGTNPGSNISDYRLFSVPGVLENPSPANFININTDLGNYDKERFRWFGFDRATQQIREYPDIGPISPDQGYFLITKSLSALNSGVGSTVNVSEPFPISVLAGWNLIGNPYNFEIPYDSLFTFPAVEFKLWRFNGDWALNTAGLVPWEGYALWVPEATNFYIKAGKSGLNKASSIYDPGLNEGENWIVQLKAFNDSDSTTHNFFGQDEHADNDFDNLDLIAPPTLKGQLSLKFLKDVPQVADIREPQDGQQWTFKIDNLTGSILTLDMTGLDDIKDDKEVFLFDRNTKTPYNLRHQNKLDFAVKNVQSKTFDLIAGSRDYIETLDLTSTLFPTEFRLHQNFPNPFNPITQIVFTINQTAPVQLEVYNLLGQKITTLVNRQMDAGTYNAIWEAQDLSSGVYFIKLKAADQIQIKRSLLLK